MVSELEALPESYSRERTVLWLVAYEKYDRSVHGVNQLFEMLALNDAAEYRPSYSNLETFLEQLLHPPIIKYEEGARLGVKELKAFQMTVIAKNMSEWANRAEYVEKCRRVLERFPEYNATIFDGDSAILDLILTVRKDLLGSIAVTVACMATVCLFFISNKIGVLIITYIISSICFTLVGVLSWWGADMDPVTMVDVLIATGFSVDYTAHIAYHFYSETGPAAERLARSLREMSGPMLQAGGSTVLCMLPLVFVPTYAIVAFAKTVFVVVSVGLFHGLFLLPVLLSFMPRKLCHRSRDADLLPAPHKALQAKPLI
uniref:SSD domain-containing protein n=1 Tax=Steinernema glaseri TaxID=37863 RepID=A0A1I8AQY2_9BILA